MEKIIEVIIIAAVALGGIPYLVNQIKKVIPKKYAPIVALILGVIYAIGANMLGQPIDLATIVKTIMEALGVSGTAVLAYDITKKIKEK